MGKLIDWTFHLASVRPSCSGWPPLSEYGRIPGHSLPRNHSWRLQPVRATSLHSAQTRRNDSLFYLPKVYLCYSLLKKKILLRLVEASFCRMCCVEKKPLFLCRFFILSSFLNTTVLQSTQCVFTWMCRWLQRLSISCCCAQSGSFQPDSLLPMPVVKSTKPRGRLPFI